MMGWRRRKEKKHFFFEKEPKNSYLFAGPTDEPVKQRKTCKSFLFLFFKKEMLPTFLFPLDTNPAVTDIPALILERGRQSSCPA
jgi:hypothetical protein